MTALIVIVALVVVGFMIVMGIYNGLIQGRNAFKNAFAQIDVQLKRRYDLIPNLVKAVEGYMQHEKGVLENIAKYRSQSVSATSIAGKAEAENQLTQGLRQLFAVAEAYPELKANQNFLDLQSKLTDTEDQLQSARRYYNGTVRNYNILVSSFPSSIIANKFDYKTAEYFQIEQESDHAVPEVNFARGA